MTTPAPGTFFVASSDATDPAEIRAAKWEAALARHQLPDFVERRLEQAKTGAVPWLSTMTPAELLLAKTHGMKPLATVSGTCWYHYGFSWTKGHAAGWGAALKRLRQEAVACGANAVVDVRMRTITRGAGDSMDFTLFGTAVRFSALPEASNPVIATVPALEFVRLLEMDIVPTGLAVGAHYEWLTQNFATPNYTGGVLNFSNAQLPELTFFWESVRRQAHAELRADARRQGNGVLADVHFGQLLKVEQDKQPIRYLGRHIVIGTVVDTPPRAGIPHGVRTVVDMRDDLSPLNRKYASRHAGYGGGEGEGGI
jgi:hypothetical protein